MTWSIHQKTAHPRLSLKPSQLKLILYVPSLHVSLSATPVTGKPSWFVVDIRVVRCAHCVFCVFCVRVVVIIVVCPFIEVKKTEAAPFEEWTIIDSCKIRNYHSLLLLVSSSDPFFCTNTAEKVENSFRAKAKEMEQWNNGFM